MEQGGVRFSGLNTPNHAHAPQYLFFSHLGSWDTVCPPKRTTCAFGIQLGSTGAELGGEAGISIQEGEPCLQPKPAAPPPHHLGRSLNP
jgi:hypothetical protein